MGDEKKRIIWLIDNEEDQLRLWGRLLRIGIGELIQSESNIEIHDVIALPYKEDYLEILNNPETSAILIDQKLISKGGVDHTGIQLARYLRAISDIIPIYILTAVPDDDEYIDGAWTVEAIINKKDLLEDNSRKIVIARLLRNINVYFASLDDREKRFRELLKKSLVETLTPEEEKLLEELEFSRSATTLAYEQIQLNQADKYDEVFNQIHELRQMISTLQNDAKG